eukprot:COSAG01_NODE_18800_length_1052_cov_1.375656_1_plen_63_part_10
MRQAVQATLQGLASLDVAAVDHGPAAAAGSSRGSPHAPLTDGRVDTVMAAGSGAPPPPPPPQE